MALLIVGGLHPWVVLAGFLQLQMSQCWSLPMIRLSCIIYQLSNLALSMNKLLGKLEAQDTGLDLDNGLTCGSGENLAR